MAGTRVDDLITAVARRAFPTVFEADANLVGFPGLPQINLRAADQTSASEMEDLAGALLDDPVLAPIASSGETGLFVESSHGMGWQIQVRTFTTQIIGSAAHSIMARALDERDPDLFLGAVQEQIDGLRLLLSGETLTATALVAFCGFTVPEGSTASTPWGIIRRASGREAETQPFGSGLGSPAPSAILQTELPIRLVARAKNEGSVGSLHDQHPGEVLHRRSRLLTVALLLASYEGAGSPVADALWETVACPAQGVFGFTTRNVFVTRRARNPTVLDGKAIGDLEAWCRRVESAISPTTRIAESRIISAVHHRLSPEDRLIDAVMAWENLFGHGESAETVFRVTSALAIMLEDDPEKRSELKGELAKIYKARSRIVHGGEVGGGPGQATVYADDATLKAIEALRALYSNAPHLLQDRDRGVRLILGNGAPGRDPGHELGSSAQIARN